MTDAPRRKFRRGKAGGRVKRRGPGVPPGAPGAAGQPTHWGHVAGWYDALVGEKGSEYHRRVMLPGMLRLLESEGESGRGSGVGGVSGGGVRRVLDVACGQGVLCRALASRGMEVVGVDAASSLIEAGRRRNEVDGLAIRYEVADATKLEGWGGARAGFDAVTCILAIQNIAQLSPVWRGCRAALRPGGRLIVVMMHPCFRGPKISSWGWDEEGKAQYRRVDAYLSSSKAAIQMHPGSAPGETTTTFHRPLQAYVNTLGESGLLVDRLEEWPSHKRSDPTDPKAKAQDVSRREIPMFLALRARAMG